MLNIRSCYSISKSVVKIDELVSTCAKYGLTYVSICDEDFFGLPYLIKAAKAHHLKPVFGYRHLTDEGVYSFFIKTKQGYFNLIQFTNGKLSLTDILNGNDLIPVFCGDKKIYNHLIKSYPHLYYGITKESEIDEIEKIVYFKTINTLKNDDFQALELIQKIGKLNQEEIEPIESFENFYHKSLAEDFALNG